MKIVWKKPTKYSMILAIVLYLGVFFLAFYLGQKWGYSNATVDIYNEFNRLNKF